MASFGVQTQVIIRKNFMTSVRSGELWKENLVPIIAAVLNIYAATQPGLQGVGGVYLPVAIMGFTRSFLFTMIQEKSEKYK